MLEFPQLGLRVFARSPVHVIVLALCLIGVSLSLEAYAEGMQNNKEPLGVTIENKVDIKENASDDQVTLKIRNASPSVEKKHPPKRPEGVPPHSTQGPSTIQWRAPVLKGGCAQAVADYLKRYHEDRKGVKNAVSKARKELNVARLHKPQNIPSAEQRLNMARQALSAFDAETLELFGGSVPKTCVTEVKNRMSTTDEDIRPDSMYNVFFFMYRTVVAHMQTLYLTTKGVWYYKVESYVPIVKDFQSFSDVYYKKAVQLYNEAHPRPGLLTKITGKPKTVPTSEFITKIMKGLAYACVPLMLMVFICMLVLLLFPLLLIGVLIPDLIYHVWIRLFIFYYPYAMVFPADFITELQRLYAFVLEKNWEGCWKMMINAANGSVTSFDVLYYNTFIMGHMISFVSFILGVLAINWLFIFIIRKKRTTKNRTIVETVRSNGSKGKTKGKSKKQ